MDDQTPNSSSGSGIPHQHSAIEIVTTTLPPIEFPKFSGGVDNLSIWIYKCTHLFEIYKNVPDHVKLKLASIHMEGDALCWHRKFMADPKNTAITWKNYVQELENRFGRNQKKKKETTSGPSDSADENRRFIRKLQITDVNDSEKSEPDDSHFKFGPIYGSNGDKHSRLKDEAWEIVLKNYPDRSAVTTEIYSSAVREVAKEAMSCYPNEVMDSLTGTQFLQMVITDGCFFLQLALYLLGGSAGLGYPRNHNIFGRDLSRSRVDKALIESMFFPGNQIPFVVLKVLLKQTYFQNVIHRQKWEKQLHMSRLALYELLLLPELDRQSWGLWRRIPCTRVHWIL